MPVSTAPHRMALQRMAAGVVGDGRIARQADQGVLRCRVGRACRAAAGAGGRRDVHDRTAAVALHVAHRDAHRRQRTVHVDRHHAGVGVVLERRDALEAVHDAGVVDQHVEAAVPLDRPRHHRLHVVALRDVDDHRRHVGAGPADLVGNGFDAIADDVGARHHRALGRETQGHGATHARAGAGDDRDLAFQSRSHERSHPRARGRRTRPHRAPRRACYPTLPVRRARRPSSSSRRAGGRSPRSAARPSPQVPRTPHHSTSVSARTFVTSRTLPRSTHSSGACSAPPVGP